MYLDPRASDIEAANLLELCMITNESLERG